MATILIRDVSAAVHKALIREAEQSRRSKEKQALILLERALTRKAALPRTLAAAARIRRQCNREISLQEILKATESNH